MKRNKISGIYKITSIAKPNRQYVGSTIDIQMRWWIHQSDLRLNSHHSPQLQRHFNKYGNDDLTYSIIEICPIERLIEREQHYLNNQNNYFNCNPIAGSNLGRKNTEEYKQRMSLMFKGRHHSPNTEFKKGHLIWNKGKTNVFSESRLKQMSIEKKGLFAGEKNPAVKLNKTQVLEIRSLKGIISQCEMAKRYGVTQALISKIIRNELWVI